MHKKVNGVGCGYMCPMDICPIDSDAYHPSSQSTLRVEQHILDETGMPDKNNNRKQIHKMTDGKQREFQCKW